MVVHIAGTNGKGSVALKIAKTLEYSNPSLKVGLFVSPHVSSFRERMQVNGVPISEEEVVQYLPNIYQLCQEHDIPATFFETDAPWADWCKDIDFFVLILRRHLVSNGEASN